MTLTVDHLCVTLGSSRVLRDVSLQLGASDIHGVIGPNGAGKTTLVNALTGFVNVSSGRVKLGDRAVLPATPNAIARAGLRRTFQHPEPFMTIRPNEHLAVPIGNPSGVDLDRFAEDLVAPFADKPTHTLTLWELRILEIGRAISGGLKVLLLDEPAAGLDAAERDDLKDCVQRIAASGVAVLMVEHDIHLVRALAGHVTVLDGGAVITSAPTDVVASDPEMARAYLGDLK